MSADNNLASPGWGIRAWFDNLFSLHVTFDLGWAPRLRQDESLTMLDPSLPILYTLLGLCVLEVVGLKNLIVAFLGILAGLAGVTLSWVHGLERRFPKPSRAASPRENTSELAESASTVRTQEGPSEEPRPTVPLYPPVLNMGEPIQLETTLRILTDPKKEKKVSLWYTGKLNNNVLSFSEKVFIL